MMNQYNKKDLNKLSKLANKILDLEIPISKLSDEELANKTFEFKDKLNTGSSLDSLLIDAFAVAREVSFRILGKKHYKVQLMGGIALHQGRVIEMKTGEGKTLTELCPAYLNALSGNGVHIITVNAYLASRDKLEMEPFFEFLNLSVGLSNEDSFEKKEAYYSDVTYTTNTELGFDYLRDNLVSSLTEKVQRPLNYVIIDEIDSVLIDEAKTPLIISGLGQAPSNIYPTISLFIKSLNSDDFKIDKKENLIYITEKGIKKAENTFKIENLADIQNSELNHIISQMLRAQYMLKLNTDYIIQDNEIVLIDTSTGRIATGRRFSNGLHQCLEAKENVKIQQENKTLATITYQNFFKLYHKIAGMSGTVKTEEAEFKEIYSLDVVSIPTNKKIQRIDIPDKVFIDNNSKLNYILQDIIKTHSAGNPILVGTPSIEKSEELSYLLTKFNIKHNLLNAKTNATEAEIISKAGEIKAITIATNIAGRGTDIKISDTVNKLGGLKVIGTERAEIRRIDNQLIGRAGRQGNNGSSQFYLSCEDKLLKVYANSNFEKKFKKCEVLSNKSILHQIEKSQQSISSLYYDSRKYTLKYDFTVNQHRNLIYSDRNLVLGLGDISKNISDMILDEIFLIATSLYQNSPGFIDKPITKKNIFNYYTNDLGNIYECEFFILLIKKIEKRFFDKFKFTPSIKTTLKKTKYLPELIDSITSEILYFLNNQIKSNSIDDSILRTSMLFAVDTCWLEHLDEMDLLKKIVRDQSYNQKDPLDVYKIKGAEKFQILTCNIRKLFIDNLFSNMTIIIDTSINDYIFE